MRTLHSMRPTDVGDVSGELVAVRQHIANLPSLPQEPEIDIVEYAESINDSKLLELSNTLLESVISLQGIPKYYEPYTNSWLYWQTLAPGQKPRDDDDNFHIDPPQLLFSDNPHVMTRFVSGKFEIDPSLSLMRRDHGWMVDSAVISGYLTNKLTTLTYPPGHVLFFGPDTCHMSQRNITNSTQTRIVGLIGLKEPDWLR